MAFFPAITNGTNTYSGLDLGSYLLDTSDHDEPTMLTIAKPEIKSDGRSNASVALSTTTNAVTDGDPDLNSLIRVTFRWDSGVTPADLETQLGELTSFLSSANLAKLLRGER